MSQLKLEFDSGLGDRYRDLRECFAGCVYRTGLGKVAVAADVSPGNLSQMLSGDRNLDPRIIEVYMREWKDPTPALFWAARWCQDETDRQQQAMAQLPGVLAQLQDLMAQAGQGGAR